MLDNALERHIESIIFASAHPVSSKEITKTLSTSLDVELAHSEVETAIDRLKQRYQEDTYSFEIANVSGGYVFLTKGAYHHTVGTFLKLEAKKKLSRVALETLSIIAYKQPVTRTEIDAIRGVNSDYALQKLLDKELVNITGRADGPGRPLLYETSEKFFEYFGLASVKDLPKLKDFDTMENTIGSPADIMEDITASDESE